MASIFFFNQYLFLFWCVELILQRHICSIMYAYIFLKKILYQKYLNLNLKINSYVLCSIKFKRFISLLSIIVVKLLSHWAIYTLMMWTRKLSKKFRAWNNNSSPDTVSTKFAETETRTWTGSSSLCFRLIGNVSGIESSRRKWSDAS